MNQYQKLLVAAYIMSLLLVSNISVTAQEIQSSIRTENNEKGQSTKYPIHSIEGGYGICDYSQFLYTSYVLNLSERGKIKGTFNYYLDDNFNIKSIDLSANWNLIKQNFFRPHIKCGVTVMSSKLKESIPDYDEDYSIVRSALMLGFDLEFHTQSKIIFVIGVDQQYFTLDLANSHGLDISMRAYAGLRYNL